MSTSRLGLNALIPGAGLLRPVLALNIWTFTMQAWMHVTRINAMGQSKVEPYNGMPTDEMVKAINNPRAQWKADNYNHLLEQPTQFYAITLTLALLGADDDLNVGLAWGYVGLRVVHSLFQSTVNAIMPRFAMFATSSAVLVGLTARAATGFLF